MAEFEYRLVDSNDYMNIANIWKESLPKDIFSVLGKEFIANTYLPVWSGLSNSFGIIAEKEGKAAGFVIFSSSEDILKKIILRSAIGFLIATLTSFLRNPLNGLLYLDILIYLLKSHKTRTRPWIELLYIGVSPENQGKAIGRNLLQLSSTEIKNMQFPARVYVKTLQDTPHTNHFYTKLGFQLFESIAGRNVYIKES